MPDTCPSVQFSGRSFGQNGSTVYRGAAFLPSGAAIAAFIVVGIDRRDVGLLGHRQYRHPSGRCLPEDHGIDAFVDQLFPDLPGSRRVGRVIGNLHLQRLSENAAGGIHLVDGKLGSLQPCFAEQACRAAQFRYEAEHCCVIGLRVKHVVPSEYRLAVQALNKGRPIALDSGNRLSDAFKAIAADLAGLQVEETLDTPKANSIFGRLTGRK